MRTDGTHKVTPQRLFNWADDRYGPFSLDAAASRENAKCANYCTEEHDALSLPWHGRVWCNPPWGNIGPFVRHAHAQVYVEQTADLVCLLLPTRTGQSWWLELIEPFAERKLIRGRVRFGRTSTDDGGAGGLEDCGLFVFERPLLAGDLR